MRKISIEDYKRSQLPQDLLQDLYKRNWFKIFVPKDYGGLELDLKIAGQHITEAASHFGGLGWVMNLGAGANWFSGCFEDKVAQSVFSPSQTVIAGSGSDSGSFKIKGESVILNGSWKKCSGAAHASLFSLNAKDENSDTISSFIIPRELVEFSEEKWEIFGLKSTSSLTINLTDVEIPKSFRFEINTIKNHKNYKVFHIPFEQFARICMSSCFIGIAQCFLNTIQAENVFESKFETITNDLQKGIDSALSKRDIQADLIQEKSANGNLDNDIKLNLKTELGQANVMVFDEIQKLFKMGGLAFVEENNLSHWAYRDVLTGIQHYLMKP